MASDGWLRGFLKRNYLVLRCVTTIGQELPTNTNSLIGKFFVDCKQLFDNTGAASHRGRVYNMDETSIYLDCPPKYSYAPIGSKRVKVDIPMARMSAAFTAAADGTKLPIFVIRYSIIM